MNQAPKGGSETAARSSPDNQCGFSVFPAVEDHLRDGYVADLWHAVKISDDSPHGGYPDARVNQCERNHTALSFPGTER